MAHRENLRLAWFLLSAAGLMGCAGKTAPVEGRVKFKDGSDVSAMAGYGVAFEPQDGKTSAVGDIQPDGSFTLTTYGADDGALPGKHRVAITPPASPDPDKPPPKPVIPSKYQNFDTSGLAVEVKPGRNKVELELDRAP